MTKVIISDPLTVAEVPETGSVIVGETECCGRQIHLCADGKFAVQPHSDNYWMNGLESYDAALDAHENPGKYRD